MKARSMAGVLLAAWLSGCGYVETRKEVEERTNRAYELARAASAKPREGAVEDRGAQMYFGSGEVVLEQSGKSGVLNEHIVVSRGVPVTLDYVAQQITRAFGLKVSVLPDAVAAAATVQADPVGSLRGLQSQPGTFYLSYEGTVKGLLDAVAARTGNYWREEPDGSITIFHHETRSFVLGVFPGAIGMETRISSEQQTGGSGGGGGSNAGRNSAQAGQSTSVEMALEGHKELVEQVKSMLGDQCEMAISGGSGTLTATCTPPVLDRVGEFIRSVNDRKTKNILYTVRIYDVELNRNDAHGINWNIVWSSLNGLYRGGFTTLSGFGTQNSFGLALIDPSHNYAGSEVLVDALAREGKVTTLTNTTVVGLNGEVTPIQVARQTSYLARVNSTVVPDVGVTTQIEPGVATTGTTLRLWPMVLEGDDLVLQFEADLTSLRQLRRVGGSAQFVEVPEIDSRKVMQRVRMRSGQTLVVTGFEQERNQVERQGVGHPGFLGLGGGVGSQTVRSVIVAMITVQVGS